MENKVQPDASSWLHRTTIQLKSIMLIALFWLAVGLLLLRLPLTATLESRMIDPINFWIRDELGRGPIQDGRLKIFALDDATFAWLGRPDLGLARWGELLTAVAKARPKLIVVDAMLGSAVQESQSEISSYFGPIRGSGVPVVVGAFLTHSPLPHRKPLTFDQPWYDRRSYQLSRDPSVNDFWAVISNSSQRHVAYGPAPELRPWLTRIGHIQLFSDHKVRPYIPIDEEHVLPHISMFAADQVIFSPMGLSIDGKRIALRPNGDMDVNFIHRSKLQVKSLVKTLQQSARGEAISEVEAGDIVLILPLYFTGNTDFRPSPYGLIPGGHYIASMLNSILTKQWLQPIMAGEAILIFGLIAMFYLGFQSSSRALILGSLGLTIILFLTCQLLFSMASIVVPWGPVCAVLLCAMVHLLVIKAWLQEKRALMLRSALDGAVDATQLEYILKNPEHLVLEPKDHVITLMFVDVVGFSLSAENMVPRLAFEQLRKILGDISKIVHAHGGVIDKTLGDGLLCYFGYNFGSNTTSANHAEDAVRCAIAIQRHSIEQCRVALEANLSIFPLRIGINTATCYLGDMGTSHRIEFTVVGNGVNFAKRLEGACSMFSIMMGGTTWDLVKNLDIVNAAVVRRYIRIKHHQELVDAYEYDPLIQDSSLRHELSEAFRASTSLQRIAQRLIVQDPRVFLLSTDFGTGIVLNFSKNGICINLESALVPGTHVRISLDSHDHQLKPAMEAIGIRTLSAEVRWSYPLSKGIAHGLVFEEINEDLAAKLLQLLTTVAFTERAKADRWRQEESA